MNTSKIENNNVFIIGIVNSTPKFYHEIYNEKFYGFYVDIPRKSGSKDTLNVTVPEKLMVNCNIEEGKTVRINGQFRSFNNASGREKKLILTVFAKEIDIIQDNPENPLEYQNKIYLNGFICKEPVFRLTPFGRRISDILIAVNRPYNKSDYIPCIAWGKNAILSQDFRVGDNVILWGRLQSREYVKKLSDETEETRTAYEVSISQIIRPSDENLGPVDENENIEINSDDACSQDTNEL